MHFYIHSVGKLGVYVRMLYVKCHKCKCSVNFFLGILKHTTQSVVLMIIECASGNWSTSRMFYSSIPAIWNISWLKMFHPLSYYSWYSFVYVPSTFPGGSYSGSRPQTSRICQSQALHQSPSFLLQVGSWQDGSMSLILLEPDHVTVVAQSLYTHLETLLPGLASGVGLGIHNVDRSFCSFHGSV